MIISKPNARSKNLLIQEIVDEVLVYDLDSKKVHCLNSSAAVVWKNCDGKNSIKALSQHLSEYTDDKFSENFVWHIIEQLHEADLLENLPIPPQNTISRREVLKTLGLAATAVLPFVTTITAPPPISAASGPQGPQGPYGPQGPQGPYGLYGPYGPQGPR